VNVRNGSYVSRDVSRFNEGDVPQTGGEIPRGNDIISHQRKDPVVIAARGAPA